MNGFGFVAALVQAVFSLAWPAAVLVIALVFRTEIKGLLSTQLRRLKAGPFEMELDRQLAAVEANPLPSVVDEQNDSLVSELGDVALKHPAAAVLEAHTRIYGRLVQLVEATEPGDLSGRSRMNVVKLAQLAEQHGQITPETARAIEGIAVLRNLAAHSREDISPQRAIEFLMLADAVLFALGGHPLDQDDDQA